LFATKQKVAGSKQKLAEAEKMADRENEGGKRIKFLPVVLLIAAFMMSVGLIFSYSRGAWLGTVVSLLYLAKFYEKFKWRPLRVFLLFAFCFLLFGVWFFWNATPDTASWYVKRMDLGRPSAQHRVAAWRGALQIMQRHPLGVGWGNGIAIYKEQYAPPDGARALNTNDYFLLGTQLGLPGLLCFMAYVALCFRKLGNRKSEIGNEMACRAGALAMLVALWFDGALFDLPTASVFWILLELGGSILPNR
jgi:O-antigen ligase